MAGMASVGIVGAGMAGLACARLLAEAGMRVTVFDKSRGRGGRMATRRGPEGVFDHGAVALRDRADVPGWSAWLDAAQSHEAVAFWPAAQGWVGLPGMSGAVRPLATGLTVRGGYEVADLRQTATGWALSARGEADDGWTTFDQIVLAVPQPQASTLLAGWPNLQQAIAGASMRPVWTAMVRFDEALAIDGDLIDWPTGPVQQAVRCSARPGRGGGGEAWVLHASADWTRQNLERDKPEAARLLLDRFFEQAGLRAVAPTLLDGHRWRYGLTDRPLGQAFVRDARLRLGVCGDWCLGAQASDAFASGTALARALLADQ